MNSEAEWWANQRHLAERSLADLDRQQMPLNTLADDLMCFSDSFADRGETSMEEFASQLQISAAERLEEFRSAAFGVEVIFSVAVDQNWDTLPSEQVTSLNGERDRLEELISRLPMSWNPAFRDVGFPRNHEEALHMS
ncbi:hypothetical protein [Streptomyces sp. NPDC053427]|uniref:hypothetical protein n=1 Tax=Streptomyces sp. NPDC053427 TaxID=3365701 RepID=UPI0037D032D0